MDRTTSKPFNWRCKEPGCGKLVGAWIESNLSTMIGFHMIEHQLTESSKLSTPSLDILVLTEQDKAMLYGMRIRID